MQTFVVKFKRWRQRALIVAAILVLAANAHAQVTGITVPSVAYVGIKTKVTVLGSRLCEAVQVDPGTTAAIPQNMVHTDPGGLPFSLDITWNQEGDFTLTATGQGSACRGSVSKVVKVRKFTGTIAPKSDPPFTGTLVPRPQITGYFGFAKPGGAAGIVGKAFGGTVGTVTARLKKSNGGTLEVDFPYAPVIENNAESEKTPGIKEWRPGLIGIIWPDISGVRAQNATLRAKVGDRLSNEWTVAFVPELEFRLLSQGDIRVVSCSMDANTTSCNHVSETNPCAFQWVNNPFEPLLSSGSIVGWHGNCLGAVGDDSGTDVYEITLKNDWVFESFEFNRELSGDDGDYVKQPTPAFPRGASTWKPSIKWLASSDDEVLYEGFIGIIGPKGVPHK